MMCAFHDSNGNGFGDMGWTDKCTYFSIIDVGSIVHDILKVVTLLAILYLTYL